MILRKPYALFIKYFKLMHIILALLNIYIIYSTNLLMSFFNNYLKTELTTIGSGTTTNYFNFFMFIAPLIMAIFSIVVLSLMVFKKKPAFYYLFSFIVSIYLIIIFAITMQNMQTLEVHVIDIRILRAIRDFLMGGLIFESITLIINIIRGTGFDIKKFNFGQDLDELNISEEDREEFEVEVNFDPEQIKNNYRRKLKNIRYTYIENKSIIQALVVFTIVALTAFIIVYTLFLDKNYGENTYFGVNGLSMRVINSYVTQKDHYNYTIDEDQAFVVVKLEVVNYSVNQLSLSKNDMKLVIDGVNYFINDNYNESMIDLGNIYNRDIITEKEAQYIFVYQIPATLMDKNMVFRYSSISAGGQYNNNVKLSPIKLDKNLEKTNYNLGEKIDFSNSVLKNTSLTISEFDMASGYLLNYYYCASSTYCYDSLEYVGPNILSNYNKMIMRFKMDYTFDENLKNTSFKSASDILSLYGQIEYTKDGNTKIQTVPLIRVIPNKIKDNNYYKEILEDISGSNKIILHINVRNKTYSYILRDEVVQTTT